MIKFWDVIYLKDEMSEMWIKFMLFQLPVISMTIFDTNNT